MITNLTKPIAEKFSSISTFPPKVTIVSVDLSLLQDQLLAGGDESETTGGYLHSVEQVQYHAFRYGKRKVEWLGGRIAAKCAALQLLLHSCENNWEKDNWLRLLIAVTDHGKPFLQGPLLGEGALPHISISHTTGLAVGIAAEELCGVDVQKISPAVQRVQQRFCSQWELQRLEVVAKRYNGQTALALLWSAKEAVKKAEAVQLPPGFMVIILQDIIEVGAGFMFKMEVPDQGRRRKRRVAVWVCLWQNLSFALTVFHESS